MGLFESGLNAGEGCVQVRADALHDRDDRDRDAGGDKAVLDGGRSRLVLHKAQNDVSHGTAPGRLVAVCPILTATRYRPVSPDA